MMPERSIEDMTPAPRKRGRKSITNAERAERDAALVRDRLRGQSWPYLSSKYDLTVRACREVFDRWREQNQPTYQGRDPIHIVHSMLDRLESWVEQLAEVADSTASASVQINAINAQLNALTKTAELMQATGILPHDLGTLRIELDIQTLAVRLVQVLTENGASPQMKRAILDALKSDAMPQPELSNGTS